MTVWYSTGGNLSSGVAPVDTTQVWGYWMLPHRRAIIHGVRRGKCRVLFDGWVIERPVPK